MNDDQLSSAMPLLFHLACQRMYLYQLAILEGTNNAY